MGLLNRILKKNEKEQPETPNQTQPSSPAAPTPPVKDEAADIAEKNTKAIHELIQTVDKTITSLLDPSIPEDRKERCASEFNSLRMQLSGIVPKTDVSNIYQEISASCDGLSEMIRSGKEEDLARAFHEIRESLGSLRPNATEMERSKAVINLQIIQVNCKITGTEHQVQQFRAQADQVKQEMKDLFARQTQEGPTDALMAEYGRKSEEYKNLENTIGTGDTTIQELQTMLLNLQNNLRTLQLNPTGQSVKELVGRIRQNLEEVSRKFDSQAKIISEANEAMIQAVAEIRVQNRETEEALQNTTNVFAVSAQEAMAKQQQEMLEEQRRQAARAAAEAKARSTAAAETNPFATLEPDQ